VGSAGDDRVSRPAVRAVRERVMEAPVQRVVDLAETLVAGRELGGDGEAPNFSLPALFDYEAIEESKGKALCEELVDARGGRRLVLELFEEHRDVIVFPVNVDCDTLRAVRDASGQSELRRKSLDPRPEPDTLHDAA